MGALLLWSMLLTGTPGAPADTAVEARRGDRVVVERFTGDLVVETWTRPTVAIVGNRDDLRGISIARSGNVLTVLPDDRKERRRSVEMVLRVPPWVDLSVEGRDLDVHVTGLEGEVAVRNVSGDVTVDGPAGAVDLNTMDGELVVRGARGPVRAHSRGDDVRVQGVRGDVDVRTGDGDLHIEDVVAPVLRAETLDGDVFFSGVLVESGSYEVSLHDGDATVVLPDDVDAHVTVSTFDGDFASEFPVRIEGYRGGGTFDFTLGRGSARLKIEVFDGEIRLERSRSR